MNKSIKVRGAHRFRDGSIQTYFSVSVFVGRRYIAFGAYNTKKFSIQNESHCFGIWFPGFFFTTIYS